MLGKWKKKSVELEGRLHDANKSIEQLSKKLSDCQQQRESLSEELAISVSQMADLRQQYNKVCVSLGDMRKKYQKTIDIEEFNKLLLSRRSELEKRAEDAQLRLNGQQAEIEKNLAVLSVLNAQTFAKVDLELDLKLVLRECEERLRNVEKQAKAAANKEYAEVEYCFSMNGSRAQGKKYQNQIKKLAKRALDGSVQLALSKATVKNAQGHRDRVTRAFKDINQLIDSSLVRLKDSYLESCILKLDLKVQLMEAEAARRAVEKEERAILREEARQEREELRLKEDAKKAIQEEARLHTLLEQARKEVEDAIGEKRKILEQRIMDMGAALAAQHERVEKANSMAQLTKAGHVYVISNEGAFGEDCYKIGMTRRLVPEERVKELGDASVPFSFDMHAMVYSQDARALEDHMHKIFHERRVNMVNPRKEFFYLSIEEIIAALRQKGVDAEVKTTALAEEYRESKRLRALAKGDKTAYLRPAKMTMPDTSISH